MSPTDDLQTITGQEHDASPAPIGVFDSGLGGMTVARALRETIPNENIIYFGDTARLPYGTKSPETVYRFTRQCLKFLMSMRPKLLVVACNTATALALEKLKNDFSVPLIGVVEPGSRAAAAVANSGPTAIRRIGLIATEATIASNAYPIAIRKVDSSIHVVGRATPLLVPMIEEGRGSDDPVVKLVLHEYLRPFLEMRVAALILGCTHYPILSQAVQDVLGPDVQLIDSARQTALVVREQLVKMNALANNPDPGMMTCYVTDQGQRFERLAGRFLGQPVGQPVWVGADELEGSG